jgi:hypothetical protein
VKANRFDGIYVGRRQGDQCSTRPLCCSGVLVGSRFARKLFRKIESVAAGGASFDLAEYLALALIEPAEPTCRCPLPGVERKSSVTASGGDHAAIKILGFGRKWRHTLGRGIERPIRQERVPLQRVGFQVSKVGSGPCAP